MTPSDSLFDISNGVMANRVISSNRAEGPTLCDLANYLHDIIGRKFRWDPTFDRFVCHIIRVTSEKEVGWLYTPWIIARVKNVKRFVKWAVGHPVNKPMDECVLATDSDPAITIHSLFPCPLGTLPNTDGCRIDSLKDNIIVVFCLSA